MSDTTTRRDIRIARMAQVRRELEQHPALLAPTRKPPKQKKQNGVMRNKRVNGVNMQVSR